MVTLGYNYPISLKGYILNITSDCITCLLNQSVRVAKNLNLDKPKSEELTKIAEDVIAKYRNVTPIVVASDLYPKMSEFVGSSDIYANLKAKSTKEALKLLVDVEATLETLENRLKGAIKASVAGNVIDFATPNQFDLVKEFKSVFKTPFTIDNQDEFLDRLESAKSFMIVGDNVGEHVFDKLLLQEIAIAYPDIELYYATRGVPIINDVTTKEAKEIGLDEVATLVDSGVDTPGLDYSRASSDFMKLYNSMDLILAKGMGNYEALDEVDDGRIYHLLKVKCEVVASSIKANLGDLVFKVNSTQSYS